MYVFLLPLYVHLQVPAVMASPLGGNASAQVSVLAWLKCCQYY